MPYPSEHAARLQSPDNYKDFRRENDKFGTGIHAIWGIREDGRVELQAIRFDKDRFSPEEAKKWLKEHNMEPQEFEPAKDESLADGVEREARLLRAGEYPQRGLAISEEDLDAIIRNSGEDIPLHVEHRPTLLLGKVRELYRRGKELWGKIWLSREANRILEESDARSISISLDPQELRIHEVSVVGSPHLPDAQIFADSKEEEEDKDMNDEAICHLQEKIQELAEIQEQARQKDQQIQQLSEQVARLQEELHSAKIREKLAELQREGHLTPAMEPIAQALLQAAYRGGQLIRFGESDIPMADLVEQLIRAIPPMPIQQSLQPGEPIPEKFRQFADGLKSQGYALENLKIYE